MYFSLYYLAIFLKLWIESVYKKDCIFLSIQATKTVIFLFCDSLMSIMSHTQHKKTPTKKCQKWIMSLIETQQLFNSLAFLNLLAMIFHCSFICLIIVLNIFLSTFSKFVPSSQVQMCDKLVFFSDITYHCFCLFWISA